MFNNVRKLKDGFNERHSVFVYNDRKLSDGLQ
jgi:hypothetical protein